VGGTLRDAAYARVNKPTAQDGTNVPERCAEHRGAEICEWIFNYRKRTSVKKSEPPNQEELEALLAWLDSDRERAWIILYGEIHLKLIKISERHQCPAAEELADEAINRVSHRLKDIAGTYVGDRAIYFYGVLRKVYLEWLDEEGRKRKWLEDEKRKKKNFDSRPLHAYEVNEPDVERIHRYLEKCRQRLEVPEDRELILKYYEKERRAKIDHRKQLAASMGITLNNLRMRIHRINAILQKCIENCLNDGGSAEAGDVLAG
jgi:DNA-directed RNA polymerase specialized sigma24 family protein